MRIGLFTLLSLLMCGPVLAAEHYGLAMVGKPKYDANNTHLEYANPDAPKGGALKQSAIGTFDTLNPLTIKGKAPDGLNLTTDRLMARVWGEPFTLYPLVAEKADIPEDRSHVIFTLNKAARFHDGHPMTSEDVLFSFETLREFGRPNMRRIYKLATPKVIDDYSIRFDFGEGHDRETVMIFAMMPVLPKHYWDGKVFDQTTLEAPLGSGPYKLVTADPGKKVVYERVPDYWAQNSLTNRGHHNFDQIIYEYYRDDTVALESFKKGDLSVRREWDAGDWNNSYMDIDDDIIKEELKHGRAAKVRAFIFNTRRAPFNDREVREALNIIFDFDWMNKSFFYGKYQRIGNPLLRTGTYFPNTNLGYEHDLSNVKLTTNRRALLRIADETLKQHGWIVKEGIRINEKTGEAMRFEILLDTPSDEKIALSYARNLKKMGIEARVRVLDSAAYRGRMKDYDFDMTLHYWHSTLSPGTEQYLYWSCEAAEQPSRWNFAGVCDLEIDELAKAIPAAKTREELLEKTKRLDQRLQGGMYMVPLYYNPYDYVAYWRSFRRPDITPLYGIVLETWWMDQDGNQP